MESNLGPSPTVFSDKGIRKDGISLKNKALFLQLSICMILSQAVAAPSQGFNAPPVSVPPALASARTIFVSNAGADSGLFPQPFSGDPARGYTQFVAAMKSSGQFNLVSDPSEADLVLELELIAPNGPSSGNKQNGASDPVPMFRLRIYDRKTHYILWTITESIEVALKQKTHDRNFDQALQNILFDFQQLTGRLPTGPH